LDIFLVWTQGLTLARQVLYHLSHIPNLFLFLVIFWVGSLVFAQAGLNSRSSQSLPSS
jgi:hypothetical protein